MKKRPTLAAREQWSLVRGGWPVGDVPESPETELFCLHHEGFVRAGDLRLTIDPEGPGGVWIECALDDCDGSPLDLWSAAAGRDYLRGVGPQN